MRRHGVRALWELRDRARAIGTSCRRFFASEFQLQDESQWSEGPGGNQPRPTGSGAPERAESEGIVLTASKRCNPGGTRPAALRSEGKVPGMLFSQRKHRDKQPISLDKKEMERAVKEVTPESFVSRLISLMLEDGHSERVLPQQLQVNPLTGDMVNATFMRAPAGAIVKAYVPVRVFNEDACPGIGSGGFIHVVKTRIHIKCYAEDLPPELYLDASIISKSRHAFLSDLPLPEGCRVLEKDLSQPVARIGGGRRGN